MTETEYNEKRTALENAARETITAFNANIEAQFAAKDARIAELEAALDRLANQLPDCLLDWMAPAVSNSNVSAIRQARDDAHRLVNSPKGEVKQ